MNQNIGVAWEFNPNVQSQYVELLRYQIAQYNKDGKTQESTQHLYQRYIASGCTTFEAFKAKYLTKGN